MFGSEVVFQCEYQGVPAPTVTWYHNGNSVQPDSRMIENSSLFIILQSELQVSHTGVYQCVVSNTIDGAIRVDRRQWVLEVSEQGMLM